MADVATNLTDNVADTVSIWSPAAQNTLELHESFLSNDDVMEPAVVAKPNAEAVETELQYTSPGPAQVPALDGLVNYIAQETAKPRVTNKYYTTTRKHYHFIETYSPLIYQKIKR